MQPFWLNCTWDSNSTRCSSILVSYKTGKVENLQSSSTENFPGHTVFLQFSSGHLIRLFRRFSYWIIWMNFNFVLLHVRTCILVLQNCFNFVSTFRELRSAFSWFLFVWESVFGFKTWQSVVRKLNAGTIRIWQRFSNYLRYITTIPVIILKCLTAKFPRHYIIVPKYSILFRNSITFKV